jgi:hypothetical protein
MAKKTRNEGVFMNGIVPGKDGLIVLQYTHIDDTSGILKAEKILDCTPENLALLGEVKAIFKSNGWEGDGELGLFWIPPFYYSPKADEDMTEGVWVWHVKQHNNGVSFLGIEKEGLDYLKVRRAACGTERAYFNPRLTGEKTRSGDPGTGL